jgi:hypothetical protein
VRDDIATELRAHDFRRAGHLRAKSQVTRLLPIAPFWPFTNQIGGFRSQQRNNITVV